jgi:hypothetical protein
VKGEKRLIGRAVAWVPRAFLAFIYHLSPFTFALPP